MKKVLSVLLLSTLLILVFTSCKTTFDGYSYNIDDARKQEASYYEEYDYIFSIEDDGNYVDFLVCGGQLRIVKFDTKEQSNTTLYKIKSKATFLIDEALASTDSETAWTKRIDRYRCRGVVRPNCTGMPACEKRICFTTFCSD